MPVVEPHADLSEEARVVWRWRFDAATKAGLSPGAARLLADGEIEAYEIRRLAELGYTPDQIFKLLT